MQGQTGKHNGWMGYNDQNTDNNNDSNLGLIKASSAQNISALLIMAKFFLPSRSSSSSRPTITVTNCTRSHLAAPSADRPICKTTILPNKTNDPLATISLWPSSIITGRGLALISPPPLQPTVH